MIQPRPDRFSPESLSDRVLSGNPLTPSEGLDVLESVDHLTLGAAAQRVREACWGKQVTYNRNRHLHPTNICVYHCRFCSFYRRPGDPGGYLITPEEAVNRIRSEAGRGITELHLVGGCHPTAGLEYYTSLFRALKAAYPTLHIKSMTAVEIQWLAKLDKCSVEEVLKTLKASGLNSLPGGGAEIFDPEIRNQVCESKCTGEEWLEVHAAAHGLGLPSNATMLFGHIETSAAVVDHLDRLRSLQNSTGGFMAFIPLAYHPENNDLGLTWGPTAARSLRITAFARLYLHNFPHIKAYWMSLGLDVAQIALSFGADDLDGTVVDEHIYRDAGTKNPEALSENELQRLIRAAGYEPVERDSLFNRL